MGNGTFTHDAYRSYARSTGHETLSRERLFNPNLHRDLDPSKFLMRESRDSSDHRNSTPMMFGLDVTGSMGFVAEQIAKVELVKLMTSLLEDEIVTDPQLGFMGIGDIHCDRVPVQVSQFESDIRVLSELRKLHLEGGGGGNKSESYDMAWYVGAYRTQLDCLKREQKGFMFTMGDEEAPFQLNTAERLASVFGHRTSGSVGDTQVQLMEGVLSNQTPTQLLKLAQRQYNVFHIIVEEGSYFQHASRAVKSTWREMLGKRVISMKSTKDLTDLVIAAIRLESGVPYAKVIDQAMNPDAVIYGFSQE